MARRNLGVLIRQLVGNGNNPPGCAAAAAAGLPKQLDCNYNYIRIRTLSCSIPIPSTTRSSSSSSPHPPVDPTIFERFRPIPWLFSETGSVVSDPSNGFLLVSYKRYCEALKKVQDERISAVFFHTAPCCKPPSTYDDVLKPIFYDLCEQFPHVAIFLVYTEPNGGGIKLQKLGVYDRPVFHVYLKGEKVAELASASEEGLKKNLENVYNPSGMNERNDEGVDSSQHVEVPPAKFPASSTPKVTEAVELASASEEGLKKNLENVYNPSGMNARNDEGVDSSQLVEVPPAKFPASSTPKVTEVVESLPGGAPDSDMWWFAQGLFVSQKKREEFSSIEDPDLKLKWLEREMAEE